MRESTTTTIHRLADVTIGATAPELDEQGRRIALSSLWDLLAAGDPVTPAALAARAGVEFSGRACNYKTRCAYGPHGLVPNAEPT